VCSPHANLPHASWCRCSGSWATETFKVYNFESAGKEVGGGHEHVLMKVRGEFRQILLEMG